MYSLKASIFLSVFILTGLFLHSQTPLHFEQISFDQGLSQINIPVIIQDRQGFLWVGTGDGLNRFDGYTFKVFKHDDADPTSISNNSIWTLYEDKKGIIWVGTHGGGLNAFDPGKETFKIYYPRDNDPASLSGPDVLSVLEDQNNRLWVGTERNGLNIMDRKTGKFWRFKDYERYPKALTEKSIYALYEDNEGNIWVGSYGGLTRISSQPDDNGQFIFKTFESGPKTRLGSNAVRAIYPADSQNIWVGTWNAGLYLFNLNTETFTPIRHRDNDSLSLSSDFVSSILQTRSGEVWVGTFSAGLNQLIGDQQFYHYQHKPGSDWHISSDFVSAIYEDNSGVLWIGTYGGGLSKYEPSAARFKHVKQEPNNANSLSYNLVFGIQEDQNDNVWLATHGGGLNRYDPLNRSFTHFQYEVNDPTSISNPVVISLGLDSMQRLWVGTRSGLDRLKPDGKGFDHFYSSPGKQDRLHDQFIWSLYTDSKGVLWIGTRRGISRFNQEDETFDNFPHNPEDPYSLNNNIVLTMLEDRKGRFWIGTRGGLNRLKGSSDVDTVQFEAFVADPETPSSLSNNIVNSLLEDRKGRLWIGTEGGLNRMIEGENGVISFVTYTTDNGLPNDMILGMEEDNDGFIWVSTNYGISVFDPDKITATENPSPDLFRNYGLKDGLQSYSFHNGSSYKTRSGELYFGGVNGFNHFNPARLRDNLFIPPVKITDLKILEESVPVYKGGDREFGKTYLNTSISLASDLQLTYRDYSISFAFAALSFDQPQKNQYAYKLEGFDEDWVFIGNRRNIYFTNLDPGNYTLKVRGSNNDGIWNKSGTSLKINVSPPPWKSWWAICLYVIIGVGLILAYIRYQVRKREEEIETRNRIEMAKVSERERVRKNTSADFHDELGHKLTKISLFMELARRQLEPNSKVSEYFQKIEKNTQSLSEGMRDLIWILDPGQDSLLDTIVRLKDFGDNLFEHTDITFRTKGITDSLAEITMEISARRHLVMIFKEVMHNTLKYAAASQVLLSVNVNPTEIMLSFQDNGKGFDPEQKSKGYGLRNMRERAEKIQAEFRLESSPGEGTLVEVRKPLPQMRD
jgi:ligand-binding sensor domain-containing protein/signal transduction histidine kinase